MACHPGLSPALPCPHYLIHFQVLQILPQADSPLLGPGPHNPLVDPSAARHPASLWSRPPSNHLSLWKHRCGLAWSSSALPDSAPLSCTRSPLATEKSHTISYPHTYSPSGCCSPHLQPPGNLQDDCKKGSMGSSGSHGTPYAGKLVPPAPHNNRGPSVP